MVKNVIQDGELEETKKDQRVRQEPGRQASRQRTEENIVRDNLRRL